MHMSEHQRLSSDMRCHQVCDDQGQLQLEALGCSMIQADGELQACAPRYRMAHIYRVPCMGGWESCSSPSSRQGRP